MISKSITPYLFARSSPTIARSPSRRRQHHPHPLHAVLTVAHAVTSTTLTSDDCERRRRCYPWPALKSSCYFPVAYVVASTALTSDDGSRCPCRYPRCYYLHPHDHAQQRAAAASQPVIARPSPQPLSSSASSILSSWVANTTACSHAATVILLCLIPTACRHCQPSTSLLSSPSPPRKSPLPLLPVVIAASPAITTASTRCHGPPV
ncbi:hypothetical protein GW17_00049854 [Ensete ventricosum]|nr:hypothetical protein GW17_00049854 [Ensete ventricosum]